MFEGAPGWLVASFQLPFRLLLAAAFHTVLIPLPGKRKRRRVSFYRQKGSCFSFSLCYMAFQRAWEDPTYFSI